MRKILFLRGIRYDGIGGIEEKILSMAEYLAQNKIIIPFLATNDTNSRFAMRFQDLGLRVYGVPYYISLFGYEAGKEIEKIVKKEGIALLQSHMFRESLAGRWVRARNPQVRHIARVHTHFEIPYLERRKLRQWLYYRLESLTSRYVDRYVTISNLVRNNLVRYAGIDAGRVEVVHNGIIPMGACDAPNDSDTPLDARAVIIASLETGKQQKFAIELVNALRTEGINLHLYLVGGEGPDHNYRSEARNLAKTLGVEDLIHFCGYHTHDEIADLIRDIPLVMLPSLSEGIPTSILEGMSLRKLVLVSDGAGATSELVQHNVNGLMLRPKDKDQWIRQLLEIFTSPARKWEPIRNAGYDTWKNHYSLEVMMHGMISIYRAMGMVG